MVLIKWCTWPAVTHGLCCTNVSREQFYWETLKGAWVDSHWEQMHKVSMWGTSQKLCMLKHIIHPTIHILLVPMLLYVDIMVRIQGFMILCSVTYATGKFCFQNMQWNALQNLKSVGLFMCLSTFLNEAANKRNFPTQFSWIWSWEMRQGSSQHRLICLNSSHLALALIILANPHSLPRTYGKPSLILFFSI